MSADIETVAGQGTIGRQEPYLPNPKLRPGDAKGALTYVYWAVYLVGYYLILRYLVPQGPLRLPVMAVGILIPFAYQHLHKRYVSAWNRESAAALVALAAHRPAEAERDLRAVRRRFAWPASIANVTDYNLAIAIHRQGRHAEAIDLLASVDRRGGATAPVNINAGLASSLAYFHALVGEVEPAEAWLTESRLRFAALGLPQGSELAELAVALRRGQGEEAVRRLDADWARIEHARKGETLRPLRLLRAFAIAQAGGAIDVAGLQPAQAQEFAYLATRWPELGAFLQRALPGEPPLVS
jgi:hypothetical protein